MEHLIILFNLLTLFLGLVLAGVLFRRWRATPSPLLFWQLLHFLGFTFTMVVAALDAYWVVNMGVGTQMTRAWSSAVMVGTALMMFSFPHLARAEAHRPRPRRFSVFWALAALFPVIAALLLLVIEDFAVLLTVIAVGFLPFWASILYGLSMGTKADQTKKQSWLVFLLLLAVGVAEVWWVIASPPQSGYFFVTLPLAYFYTVLASWKARSASPTAPQLLMLPPEVAQRLGLSPRELEMAAGILRGLSNKELAFEAGLSENTVRNHISNLYRKLGIQKRLDLVLLVQKYQAE